jgi:hypothetical protein
MTNVNPPTTPSAALHAERIKARTKSKEQAPAGQSTAEQIASRILPGYRADEALREEARKRELQARGIVSADEDLEGEVDEEEGVEPEDEEEDETLSTAERYAARERKRQTAERKATLAAHKGAVQTTGSAGHRSAAQLAQPHRQAHLWQKPAS